MSGIASHVAVVASVARPGSATAFLRLLRTLQWFVARPADRTPNSDAKRWLKRNGLIGPDAEGRSVLTEAGKLTLAVWERQASLPPGRGTR